MVKLGECPFPAMALDCVSDTTIRLWSKNLHLDRILRKRYPNLNSYNHCMPVDNAMVNLILRLLADTFEGRNRMVPPLPLITIVRQLPQINNTIP